MQSAYHSPGKGLQQHNVLMLDTQINLRPVLTALLGSIWTHLVSLNRGHLDSKNCFFFFQGNFVFWFKCYNVLYFVGMVVMLKKYLFCSSVEREYKVCWEYFKSLCVCLCR